MPRLNTASTTFDASSKTTEGRGAGPRLRPRCNCGKVHDSAKCPLSLPPPISRPDQGISSTPANTNNTSFLPFARTRHFISSSPSSSFFRAQQHLQVPRAAQQPPFGSAGRQSARLVPEHSSLGGIIGRPDPNPSFNNPNYCYADGQQAYYLGSQSKLEQLESEKESLFEPRPTYQESLLRGLRRQDAFESSTPSMTATAIIREDTFVVARGPFDSDNDHDSSETESSASTELLEDGGEGSYDHLDQSIMESLQDYPHPQPAAYPPQSQARQPIVPPQQIQPQPPRASVTPQRKSSFESFRFPSFSEPTNKVYRRRNPNWVDKPRPGPSPLIRPFVRSPSQETEVADTQHEHRHQQQQQQQQHYTKFEHVHRQNGQQQRPYVPTHQQGVPGDGGIGGQMMRLAKRHLSRSGSNNSRAMRESSSFIIRNSSESRSSSTPSTDSSPHKRSEGLQIKKESQSAWFPSIITPTSSANHPRNPIRLIDEKFRTKSYSGKIWRFQASRSDLAWVQEVLMDTGYHIGVYPSSKDEEIPEGVWTTEEGENTTLMQFKNWKGKGKAIGNMFSSRPSKLGRNHSCTILVSDNFDLLERVLLPFRMQQQFDTQVNEVLRDHAAVMRLWDNRLGATYARERSDFRRSWCLVVFLFFFACIAVGYWFRSPCPR